MTKFDKNVKMFLITSVEYDIQTNEINYRIGNDKIFFCLFNFILNKTADFFENFELEN
jgi:hypothetical protein